ncbi:hypothetical protein TRIUR3_34502 [Triticum urartu]|uniref:Uncharacterized protein n=1 Tax=Triticum urartu TaxID=4572 RepID=M7YLQ8_TRIUA|nr:hypothetical protein TRIUR3_34502 [Triticum urartu]
MALDATNTCTLQEDLTADTTRIWLSRTPPLPHRLSRQSRSTFPLSQSWYGCQSQHRTMRHRRSSRCLVFLSLQVE